MVYCEKCGQENASSAKFCKNCGSSTTQKNVGFSPSSSRVIESIGFGDRRTGEKLVIHCTLCGNQDFARDKGRLDSKWGFTSFKVIIMTCKNCGHVELFNKGRSIFDFD
jgi:uncharacterized OB-fold protein